MGCDLPNHPIEKNKIINFQSNPILDNDNQKNIIKDKKKNNLREKKICENKYDIIDINKNISIYNENNIEKYKKTKFEKCSESNNDKKSKSKQDIKISKILVPSEDKKLMNKKNKKNNNKNHDNYSKNKNKKIKKFENSDKKSESISQITPKSYKIYSNNNNEKNEYNIEKNSLYSSEMLAIFNDGNSKYFNDNYENNTENIKNKKKQKLILCDNLNINDISSYYEEIKYNSYKSNNDNISQFSDNNNENIIKTKSKQYNETFINNNSLYHTQNNFENNIENNKINSNEYSESKIERYNFSNNFHNSSYLQEKNNNNKNKSNINLSNEQVSISQTNSNINLLKDQSKYFSNSVSMKIKRKKINYIKYKNKKLDSNDYKTVLLLGEKGSGKSSFINCFLNYCKNIKYKDEDRYYITKKIYESTLEPEEFYISENNKRIKFIDTPGFYGNEKEEYDKNNLNKIFNFISNKKIHLIGFVFCSDISRKSRKLENIVNLSFSFLKKENIENIILIFSNFNGESSLISINLLLNINNKIFSSIIKKRDNRLEYVISNWNIFFEEYFIDENERLYEKITKNFNQFFNLLNKITIVKNFLNINKLNDELKEDIKNFIKNFNIYIKSLKNDFKSFFEVLPNNYYFKGKKYKYTKDNNEKLKNVLLNLEQIDKKIENFNQISLIEEKTDNYIKNNLEKDVKKNLFDSIYENFKSNLKDINSVLENKDKIDDYFYFNKIFKNSSPGIYIKKLLEKNKIEEINKNLPYPNSNSNNNDNKEKYNVKKDLYYKNKYDYTIYKFIYDFLNKKLD